MMIGICCGACDSRVESELHPTAAGHLSAYHFQAPRIVEPAALGIGTSKHKHLRAKADRSVAATGSSKATKAYEQTFYLTYRVAGEGEVTRRAACGRHMQNLSIERSACALRMVDISGADGAALASEFGAPSAHPSVHVFRNGAATLYTGARSADAIVAHVLGLGGEHPNGERSATAFPETQSAMLQPALLSLTPQTVGDALHTHPLLLLLGVGVKLGLLQVRPTTADAPPDAAFHALRKRYSVGDLPEIKIFDRGQPLDYAAAADVDSIVDVARWNAGRSTVPTPTSRVVPLLGTEQLRRLLQPSSGLVLLVFRARWCTRCLVLEPQLHTASVTIATVDIDDERNQGLVREIAPLGFPSTIAYWRGGSSSLETGKDECVLPALALPQVEQPRRSRRGSGDDGLVFSAHFLL
ncbi:hypothetical protein EMIHUDRAFT_205443 [Emiliania huxleyi CCMP1516]|uniref:Thioredoxin domain-containing protein n=2 Tax=Emiliania huxleyi TaxID=2903 RepID=A0A0D3JSD3_EMIH1|nr:hypothetical protein EMIHUDRAFT_205443 [Emiliania huxleyi CCMP1516]EOD26418.1 hypothetical protein EMIHUDRAFT_205443 [Emiliania huxleyi CCMP1516]|eukprot:XP_005778847.1 hypothetical protein EMIHUDRAFT_205443 [Emiliania huxleyi CCMP1516]